MDYRDYNDNEVLSYIYENNEEASEILYKKYEPLINLTATKFFKYCKSSGLELNDLIQEGMMGLTNAINHFDESKDTLFYSFARTCIERKMISIIVSTRRQKHQVLNNSISFESFEDEQNKLDSILSDNSLNPEQQIINKEQTNNFFSKIKEELTDLEMQVLDLKMAGFTYKEIGDILDKDYKAIDNAVQRIRVKVKKILDNASV